MDLEFGVLGAHPGQKLKCIPIIPYFFFDSAQMSMCPASCMLAVRTYVYRAVVYDQSLRLESVSQSHQEGAIFSRFKHKRAATGPDFLIS